MEIWKDVCGYEGLYQVSNLGRIKSTRKSTRLLTPFKDSYGYFTVCLCKNGIPHRIAIHRLVAIHFVDNPDNLPCVNHKDECKQNNEVSNLEWCDKAYNNAYGTHPLQISEANSRAVFQIKNGEIVNKWNSCSEANRKGGYTVSCISRCCSGERRKHKGYEWRWAT